MKINSSFERERPALSALERYRKAVVLGIGVSNIPLIGFLLKMGVSVTACDAKPEDSIPQLQQIKDLGVATCCGEGYLKPLSEAGCVIFRTPGMRPDLPEITDSVLKGSVLSSEMELFFELCPATIIGVTGSDGKTTTTTVIEKLLSEEFHGRNDVSVYVGGNIGTPLLPLVGRMTDMDFAVCELSSFQLMTMKDSPDISVVTNITPNHLNWHTCMEEYIAAKSNIYIHPRCRKSIFCGDCGETLKLAEGHSGRRVIFSALSVPDASDAVFLRDGSIILRENGRETPVISASDIIIPGVHNLKNYMAAIAATSEFVSPETVRKVASSFGGVEHRCEFVREINGIRFYNSSIDSTPSRTDVTISSFGRRVNVIVCGRNKNLDLGPLAETLSENAKEVFLTGESTDDVLAAADRFRTEHPDSYFPEVHVYGEFDETVRASYSLSSPGDTVVLSPSFTSFDRFRSYTERGKIFKNIINSIEENRSNG